MTDYPRVAVTEAATETMKLGGHEGKNTQEKGRADKVRTQERVTDGAGAVLKVERTASCAQGSV